MMIVKHKPEINQQEWKQADFFLCADRSFNVFAFIPIIGHYNAVYPILSLLDDAD